MQSSNLGHPQSSRWPGLLLDRLLELLIVFLSVYAAFILNGYQIRQEENQRRKQLLNYLEEQTAGSATRLKVTIAGYDKLAREFLDPYEKGEMPPVDTVGWSSSYNENDTGWILQAGGLELLDIHTIARLREVDAVSRTGLAILAHYQKLSDEMIAPHLGDQNYFYDPATKRLRRQFAFYPETWRDGSRFLHALSDARDHLAAQLREEQKRRR